MLRGRRNKHLLIATYYSSDADVQSDLFKVYGLLFITFGIFLAFVSSMSAAL